MAYPYPSDAFLASILPAAQVYAAPAASVDPAASQDAMLAQPQMSAEPPGPPLPDIPPPGAHMSQAAAQASLQRFAPPAPSPEAVAAALRPPPAAAPAPAVPQATAPAPVGAQSPPPPLMNAGPPRVQALRTPGAPAAELPKVGPTAMALWNMGEKQQEGAVHTRAEGQKSAALHDAMQAQVQMDEAAAQQRAAEDRMRAQQQHLAEVQSSMNDDAAALAKDKIVAPAPNIGEIIGVALGAFAHGYSGGKIQNIAWDIVRKRMDDDLRMQEMNAQNRRAAFDAKQRQFNNLVQSYGMDPAKDLWAAAQREHVAAQARQMAASTSIPQIQSEADARAAELEGEANKLRASAFLGYRPATGGGVVYMDPRFGGMPLTQQQAYESRKGELERSEKHGYASEEEQQKAGYDIERERAKGEADVAKEQAKVHTEGKAQKEQAINAGRSIVATIDRVLELKGRTNFAERVAGKAGLKSDDLGRIEGDVGAIHGSYGKFKGTGVYDEGTARLLDKMTGNPGEVWGTSEAKLRELRANVVRDLGALGATQPTAAPKIDEGKL